MAFSNTTVVGRLTKDVNLRTVNTQSGSKAVANFTVACNRDFGEGADFYQVTVWGKQAENCAQYVSKGSQVLVSGRMEQGSYEATTPEGTKYNRETWTINANSVQFLDSKPNNNGGGQQQGGQQQQQQRYQERPTYQQSGGGYQQQSNNSYSQNDSYSEDDLPF